MVTIKMSKHEAKILLNMLDTLGDYYGSAGCNDYPLPNTDANWKLYRDVEEHFAQDQEEKNPPAKRPDKKSNIYFTDFALLSYLESKISKAIKAG